jgi:hypothetical protein
MFRCGVERRWPIALAATVIGMGLACAAPTAAVASPGPRVVVIHVRDLAGYKLSYMRQVDRAIQYQVNEQLHRFWHTPKVRFDAPSTGMGSRNHWLAEVLPSATVRYGFFTVANGFHLAFSPTYIEVAGFSKAIPMSEILSHEVIEALADPSGVKTTTGVLTEICDAVEQPGYRLDGIVVSNFVTPRWFMKSAVGGRFDFEGLLTRPLSITPDGFMPGRFG